MRPSRTVTKGEASLTLPEPRAVTFTFLDNGPSVVKITVPNTSKWKMNYHWHQRAVLCEMINFLPGGDAEFYRSQGVYRSSTESGKYGMPWQMKPGERCTWFLNTHHVRPVGAPDMEVIVRSAGNEDLWRNIVSATLDQNLWPELSSTPLLVRLLMRMVRMLPFVGGILWSKINRCILWFQLLLIFQRHEYWLWCGEIRICRYFHVPGEMAPEWAQNLEWKSALFLTKISMRLARVAGFLLGLKEGYTEYCNATRPVNTNPPLLEIVNTDDTHYIAG